MVKNILAILLSLALTFSPNVALAISDVDSITIDDIITPTCGEQSVTFTGSATYSEGTQHLVVNLDGTQLMDNHDEPADWTVGPTTIGVGSHTITATIYDKSDHETVMAQDTAGFTTSSCATGGNEGTAGEEGGAGDEQDCCPGPDPVIPAKTKTTGKVKGVKTQELPQSLQPLNGVFRSVYGRNPTYGEWKYWADRHLGDKPQYDALYGAMQWHQLRGRTTGDPTK